MIAPPRDDLRGNVVVGVGGGMSERQRPPTAVPARAPTERDGPSSSGTSREKVGWEGRDEGKRRKASTDKALAGIIT